jgi:ELWxxDGT repeat protein
VLVKDIYAGPAGSMGTTLTNVNGTLYFLALSTNGEEIWQSDGTEAGTVLVEDLTGDNGGIGFTQMIQLGESLLITATTEAFSRELWIADLTPSPAAQGDYDSDGDADGADFLAWQRTLGSAAAPAGAGADGDSSGAIDAGDLTVWRDNFPEATPIAVAATAAASERRELSATSRPSFEQAASRNHAADAIFAAGDFTSLFSPATGSLASRPRWRPPRLR